MLQCNTPQNFMFHSFQHSRDPVHRKLWAKVEEFDETYPRRRSDFQEVVGLVKDEKVVLLGDSTGLRTTADRDCDVMALEVDLITETYSIGLQTDSAYAKDVDRA